MCLSFRRSLTAAVLLSLGWSVPLAHAESREPITEVEWQLREIALDLTEFAAYAAGDTSAPSVSLPSLTHDIDRLTVEIDLDRGRKIPVELGVIDKGWYVPANQDRVVAALFEALSIVPSPKNAEDDLAILETLTEPRLAAIAQAAQETSDRLSRTPLDPALHERAALCLVALGFRESAGEFQDPREPMRRAVMHLALARGLRTEHHLGVVGTIAEAGLLALAHQSRSARELLDSLPPSQGGAQASTVGAWRNAVLLLATGDWRVLDTPLTATLLERALYYRDLVFRLGGPPALQFLRSRNTEPLSEWSRSALARRNLISGNVFSGTTGLGMEMRALGEVAQARGMKPETSSSLGAFLGPAGGRCIVRGPDGARPEVIGWATWSGHFQRHFLHVVYATYIHMLYSWGTPEKAKTWREQTAKTLAQLQLYPLLRARVVWDTGHEVKPADKRKPVERDEAAFRAAREFGTANRWALTPDLCRKAVDDESGLAGDPGQHSCGYWFGTGKYLRDFTRSVFVDALARSLEDRELQEATAECPTCTALLDEKARRLSKNGSLTLEQLDETYAAVLPFDTAIMQKRADKLKDRPSEYAKQVRAIAAHEPEVLFELGDYLAKHGLDSEARQVFKQAVDTLRLNIRFANAAAWYVDDLVRRGEVPEARRLAVAAAGVYSWWGLRTMARFAESTGDADLAEDFYKKIADRYQDKKPLKSFQMRRGLVEGDARYKEQAAAAQKEIFPEGLQRVKGGDLEGTPHQALRVFDDHPVFERFGIAKESLIAAVGGYRVVSRDQFSAAQELAGGADCVLSVWEKDAWRDVTGPFCAWYWGLPVWEYTAPEKSKPTPEEIAAHRLETLGTSCTARNVDACLELVGLYVSGEATGWVNRREAYNAWSHARDAAPEGTLGRLEQECAAKSFESCWRGAVLGSSTYYARSRDGDGPRGLLEQGCAGGHVQSCVDLGGLLTSSEPKRARELLEGACTSGQPLACTKVAWSFHPDPSEEPPQAATDARNALLDRACSGLPHKDPDACDSLAHYYLNYSKESKDYESLYYHDCCLAGDGACCRSEGGWADFKNPARARRLWERGCELGDSLACSIVGNRYLKGEKTAKNADRGLAILDKACQGNPDPFPDPPDIEACNTLALAVVDSDPEWARRSWSRSCESSRGEEPCVEFARRLAEGDGLPQDPAAATAELARLCDSWGRKGCRLAGLNYLEGKGGVEKNLAEAARLLGRGCDESALADARACFSLGVMYLNGEGVPRDKEKATSLFRRSCDMKLPDACRAAERLPTKGAQP